MIGKNKKIIGLVFFYVASVCCLTVLSQTVDGLVRKFLPPNSAVETLRSFNASTKAESKSPAAKIGQISGKGAKDLAFVYKTGGQLKLRVVGDVEGKGNLLDQDLPGGFLWMQDFATIGFQVLDLNGDGLDEIVTITSDGASLGGFLNIYTVRNRHMENLLDCPVDGYKFEFETGADGKYKIQIHGKGVNKESSTVEMIKWDGKKFKRNM